MTEGFKPLPTAIDIASESNDDDGVHPLKSVEGTDWHHEFELIDPFIATRDELEYLRRTAPNRLAAAWIIGIMDTRKMYAVVTGNPF